MITQALTSNILKPQLGDSKETLLTSLVNSSARPESRAINGFNDPEWLNSLNVINSNISQHLNEISFFELLDQTPTIKQLFSRDYLKLVDNLVKIQDDVFQTENYQKLLRLEGDKGFLKQHLNPTLSNDSMDLGHTSKSQALDNLQSLTPFSQGTHLQPQPTNPYNHLLYQQNVPSQSSPLPQENHHKRSNQRFHQETSAKPYDEKKKKKLTDNLSKTTIKATIQFLNNLADKLAKFVQ